MRIGAPSDEPSALISDAKYNFSYAGMASLDGHSCYVLGLHPKHKAENLVDGQVWVDATTFLPRKVDGYLSKNPSWWIKRVHLDLSFGDVSGMWLQTATNAVADVRWFGEHTLTSRAVNFQTSEVTARVHGPVLLSGHGMQARPRS